MKKRIITIDDYVYQIVYEKRIPIIKKNSIISLIKSSFDTMAIKFKEKDDSISGVKESTIHYQFKGETWVEKDRGENITCCCFKSANDYWLSLTEAQTELEKRKEKSIKEVQNDISKLNELIESIKTSS